ncbi:copper resistance protein CopD [Gluconobacter oxydans]|uniref:copper homeostasis membrane protein CopD n=1 Tax=Gluconobacter thailandicus TaxID=257438 RepID=UPI0002997818|nr:copper homeostasis membrane protein CopD [Gluconobacter thailandicus]AFW01382.1 copper resistance protein CopD [Gluconobacter oxydans H24]ANQ40026.1 copper resistance protein CopD [Gluconobacter oxydans]
MSETASIAIRLSLYVDFGTLFGLPLFAIYAFHGSRTAERYLPIRALIVALSISGLLLSVVGFAVQASVMSGVPLIRPDVSILEVLFNETALGLALKVRLAALVVILIYAGLYNRLPWMGASVSTIAGATALGTLAWSGHGAAGEGNAGWLQLAGNLIHLLAAGVWIGAIAGFLILTLRRINPDDMAHVTLSERALREFASVGTLIVGLLTLTGILNCCFLVGPAQIATLWQSTYGLLLLTKLLLFATMLALAGVNRYRLTPALGLAIKRRDARRAMALLRQSLFMEWSLAIIILALVAWLGTLSPPSSM